jgi:hypothetical protein
MMTLPPDFWTKPQPGGMTGIFVGMGIAAALWLYFFGPAYWKMPFGRSAKRMGLLTILLIMLLAVIIPGGVVGSLIGLGLGPSR